MAGLRRVLILATLDTKGDEAGFVAEAIYAHGCEPEILDLSLGPATIGDETQTGRRGGGRDVSRDQLAAAAGTSVEAIAQIQRAEAMKVVGAAAADLVAARVSAGEIDGVLGIGGGTGTWLAGEVFAALPHGFPKLLVSTLTGRDAGYDVAVLTSVVDIAGLNRLLTPVLQNAAAAICGMADVSADRQAQPRLTIALTMFGVTTAGATYLRSLLEEGGCEVVVFHANGAGGQTMERLAGTGVFDLVIDWTTSEVTDELTGGICTAGPNRLEAAAALGVPQIVVPGAIDVINVLAPIPERFEGRTHHWHLPTVPLIRTSSEESFAIGAWMGRKLANAIGPVRVLVPTLGFSALDCPGGEFEDGDADRAWEEGLRSTAGDDVAVLDIPAHINSEEFARTTADIAFELIGIPRLEEVR
jgi:uncharacterized protein (UPF0261 family)